MQHGSAAQRTWRDRAARTYVPQRSIHLHLFDDLYGPDLSGIKSGRKTRFHQTPHPFEESLHMFLRFLAALLFIGILLGFPFVIRVEPLVLGMPLVLGWIVLWVVLISVIMAVI